MSSIKVNLNTQQIFAGERETQQHVQYDHKQLPQVLEAMIVLRIESGRPVKFKRN